MRLVLSGGCLLALTMVTLVLAGGCERKTAQPASSTPAQTKTQTTQPLVPVARTIDWCKEHCVPESVCAQCNTSLAAEFKAKGDWCKEHDVPESQCFKCHPDLKEKFAAAYKQKYGKEPPSSGEEK